MTTNFNFSNASSDQNNMACQSLDKHALKISLIVVFCAILIFSLIGNTLIIIMIYRRKDLRKTANYFIANMAISDLIFPLTAIPLSLLEMWQWPIGGSVGLFFCKLKIFLIAVSMTVSVESLVWIALDRFIAVVFPIKVHRISSRSRGIAVTSTWIVAVLFCSVHLYTSELVKDNGKIKCMEKHPSSLYTYGHVRMALVYIAPLLFITILYSAIAVTLHRQDKALALSSTVIKNSRKNRKALKMSICVMAAFYLSFVPYLAVVFFSGTLAKQSCLLYSLVLLFASVALCFSSTTNPIICFIFVENYRRGFKELLNTCHIKRTARSFKIEKERREEITLQSIRVISCGDG